jgi:hypothetical protein
VTELRDGLARRDLSKTDKYLLIVASHDGPIRNTEIKILARDNGWRDGAKSHPAPFLKRSPHAILLPDGWTISGPGRQNLEQRGVISQIGVLTPVTKELERYLLKVHDPDKARFVEEAIICVRNKSFRAAIVLSWVGAVYLLYQHVLNHKPANFNTEVRRRWPSRKDASSVDDLASMKESEFLSVIEHIGVVTKGQAKELANCLDRRNTAGHPNSHTFTEVALTSHIETLISTVYANF